MLLTAELRFFVTLTIDGIVNQSNVDMNLSLDGFGRQNTTVSYLSHGVHYWNVTCSDDNYNKGTTETRAVNISSLGPTISLQYPLNEYFNSTRAITFVYNSVAYNCCFQLLFIS